MWVTSSCSILMTSASSSTVDLWFPRLMMARRSWRRSTSEMRARVQAVPSVRYRRTRGHSGWAPQSGSRIDTGRNSEPGVMLENGCARMAWSRSKWCCCSTRRLCCAAEGDHSKRKVGGRGAGDCQARTWVRMSRRTSGGMPSTGRGGRLTIGGSSTPVRWCPWLRVPHAVRSRTAVTPTEIRPSWVCSE
jgi:hypothetical protein